MNRDLNHDFYDSLIFSGQINFLEPSLQQQVQDTFKRIKKHNEYLEITKKWEMKKKMSQFLENLIHIMTC